MRRVETARQGLEPTAGADPGVVGAVEACDGSGRGGGPGPLGSSLDAHEAPSESKMQKLAEAKPAEAYYLGKSASVAQRMSFRRGRCYRDRAGRSWTLFSVPRNKSLSRPSQALLWLPTYLPLGS